MTRPIDQELTVKMVRTVTKEVLSTMLNIEPEDQDPYNEAQGHGFAEGVMSFIGLTGRVIGSGGLFCNAETACSLANSFLMADFESVNDEVLDAFGELTNMILGSLKNHFEEILGPIGLSIPTVIQGRRFIARSMSREDWIVVPFVWPGGRLEVKTYFKPVDESNGPMPHGSSHEFILA